MVPQCCNYIFYNYINFINGLGNFFPSERNSKAMAAINKAMELWRTQTCVRFKKRTNENAYVYIPGPYLGFFVCGGKLGFREISDQYSYKKQPSKIRHYVRKKTFSFPGGGNCPLRPPAMYGPAFTLAVGRLYITLMLLSTF